MKKKKKQKPIQSNQTSSLLLFKILAVKIKRLKKQKNKYGFTMAMA